MGWDFRPSVSGSSLVPWCLLARQALRRDRAVALAAVRQNGLAFEWLSEDLRSDREVLEVALQTSGCALQWADRRLTMERDLVLRAVTADGSVLRWAHGTLREDREVCLAACQECGEALQWVRLRGSTWEECMWAAVRQDPSCLRLLHSIWCDSPDLIREAVSRDGLALAFASERLRCVPCVLERRLLGDGLALQQALQVSQELVATAVRENWRAFHHAGRHWQSNPELRAEVSRQWPLWSPAGVSAGDLAGVPADGPGAGWSAAQASRVWLHTGAGDVREVSHAVGELTVGRVTQLVAQWLGVNPLLVALVPEDRVRASTVGPLFLDPELCRELLVEEARRGVFRRLPTVSVIRRAAPLRQVRR